MAVHIRFPFFLSSQTHCSKLVDSGVVIGKVVGYPVAIFVGLKISRLLFGVHFEFGGEIRLLDPKVSFDNLTTEGAEALTARAVFRASSKAVPAGTQRSTSPIRSASLPVMISLAIVSKDAR
jgi:hypothetical protein